MNQQNESLRLLEASLKELESSKGSILSGIQKLLRAANLLKKQDVALWCEIQLGNPKYTRPLTDFINTLVAKDKDTKEGQQKISAATKTLNMLELNGDVHYTIEELNLKHTESGGGYHNIGFIEEKYGDLVRLKKGNDGTYYKSNLQAHLAYVRRQAHTFASQLFDQLKFSGTTSSCFDILKNAVDDRLLDLNPTLAEQLMVAFKAVSSERPEEWSHALTSCRRLLEGLADELYPASNEPASGRNLGQAQYVNRLWKFMDNAIVSSSNRELAKTHVDYLGSWLEKTNKITNKGVHSEMGQREAVKAVFHTYLLIADILEYLNNINPSAKPHDINTASLDEFEAILNISRGTAKEIVKARAKYGKLDRTILSQVAGIGQKTLEKAIAAFQLH